MTMMIGISGKGQAIVTSAACALVMATAASAQDNTITVSSWGGSYQEAQGKAFFRPTEEALGIVIREDTTNGLQDVRLQVQGNAVVWDITQLGADECARGHKEGLFEPLDYSVIDATGIDPVLVQSDWVGITYTSVVLIYNKDVYGDNGPRTWADFWDTERFPGRRALSTWAGETLSVATLADGVPIEEVYPIDIDRALSSVERIKDEIDVWWSSGAQAMQLMMDGEVDMASIWNGRASTLVAEGAPVEFSYEQAVLTADCMVIPKGAKNKDLAMEALAHFLKPEIQANMPLHIANGPANQKAFETGIIPAELLPSINSTPENVAKQVLQDPEFWADNLVEVTERFNNLLQQ